MNKECIQSTSKNYVKRNKQVKNKKMFCADGRNPKSTLTTNHVNCEMLAPVKKCNKLVRNITPSIESCKAVQMELIRELERDLYET